MGAADWKIEGEAFSANARDMITESIREMTTWINEQVEAGATDALVDALRSKGWTVIPPKRFDDSARDLSS